MGSIVNSKFRHAWGGWCSNEVHGRYGVGLFAKFVPGFYEFAKSSNFSNYLLEFTIFAIKSVHLLSNSLMARLPCGMICHVARLQMLSIKKFRTWMWISCIPFSFLDRIQMIAFKHWTWCNYSLIKKSMELDATILELEVKWISDFFRIIDSYNSDLKNHKKCQMMT